MVQKRAEYKPLLFTTTMRNPERLKAFLVVLMEYNEKLLTDSVIEKVAKSLIQKGLYKPTKVSVSVKNKWNSGIKLNKKEVDKIFTDNPQQHKEASFEKGWASRFDTWFKLAKELGFVWYFPNEKIKFSDSGKILLDFANPENELFVFANAFAKYQRNNPFRAVANKNTPLILLIKTINFLNERKETNGISRKELPLLLCWQDDNAKSLSEAIIKIREKYGYTPSNEIILSACYKLLNDTIRDDESILVDYPDDFIRKMRLTGLFSLRGNGRFIDINSKEQAVTDYVEKNYDVNKDFASEKDFFNYIGSVDKNLLDKFSIAKTKVKTTKDELQKWVEYYSWNALKEELLNLANKKTTKDEFLSVIEQPLRLEFLISMALLKKLRNISVTPNFISDDEGLPTSFASGGNPDIECLENNDTILVEVTLLTGTQQHIRESFSTRRHLETFINKGIKAYSVFISPQTFIDTKRYFNFIKNDGFEIRTSEISTFVNALENFKTLNEVTSFVNALENCKILNEVTSAF
ncbi:MAG: AlwI family type II restriction endonuclease [Endomicrobium sp.]|uniref:AlwI family type II restriction endonuclease n=1 Tax=Candidatus Endomicrobiellum pyrsonymphae TaxID=1408203 RepID=UPI00357B17B8|nr:AlwI family type II restriction endonuclease [Endomicrobium sp.]